MFRIFIKRLARGVATLLILPCLVSYWIRSCLLGRDRALEGSTQALSLIPGVIGCYLRGAFLHYALDYCQADVTVQFGTIFSKAAARIESGAYIGPRCHIGTAHIGRDVLIGAGTHIPSGADTHGTNDTTKSFKDQQGNLTVVRIGEGSWIGSNCVVMADIGTRCVIGAGAVVTKPIPNDCTAVGVPAKVIASKVTAEV